MKKKLIVLLAAALLVSALAGCGGTSAVPEAAAPSHTDGSVDTPERADPAAETAEDLLAHAVYDDGRARPSGCGRLRVIDGKLCAEDGEPVMLRGVSTNGLITAEDLLNEQLFTELARDNGVNLIRLAMYTYGVGSVGYCTNGDKERHKADIVKGVELAREQDMYVVIDWHILSDGDPNRYLDEAKLFFSEMAGRFSGYDNVLYEICNEPNGVDWPAVKSYAEQLIPVIREKDPDSVIIVGNPDWSKDLYSVAADPLDFENILYTLHFYAASHGQEYREMTEELSRKGLPIFVSEYGVTASSGGQPRDLESADLWIELLEKENISYCLWSFSKAPAACSVVRSSVPKYCGFTEEDYTKTGLWLMDTLAKYTTR
ncbi:MAG: glycoside hydrolase family 5 protein [Oscillospiraceae bacterium]|nr:glycoside hydrolase family 5 protein [Oscillospiraceae bacterium]